MSNEDWHLQETYKSLMLYGSNAVKFVLLVNGGSVIAVDLSAGFNASALNAGIHAGTSPSRAAISSANAT